MPKPFRNTRLYNWLSLRSLTTGLTSGELRAVRTTNGIQLTFFGILLLLVPQILLFEPPETHFLSMMLFAEIVGFFIVARVFLYKRHFAAGGALTLIGLNIHIIGLCIAYADDPAHSIFLLLALLPFLAIPPDFAKLRWSLVALPLIANFADQYYYRVIGGSAIFGPPKWVVPGDYLMPPLIIVTLFFIITINSFFKAVSSAEKLLAAEHAASEKLLLNILPTEIAGELKFKGSSEPRYYASTTVCFTDFEGFTQIAESMSPAELVGELDRCFSYFDSLMERYKLEKLKTIGDSYMFAGGIPVENRTHAVDCVMVALEIQAFMNQMKDIKSSQGLPYWQLRLGIHSGNLVAGVIGEKKFAYDVWGDTVNTASRCESSGVPGQINISATTYDLVKDFFACEYRGATPAKNKGNIDMYFVRGLKPELQRDHQPRVPNEEFRALYAKLSSGHTLPAQGS
ncbi:MAG: adenylate/guanylate cyclase domain-containing protein [Turneriella sp.]